MGMFDYVKCEVPLPDGYTGELQTKDFDCELETHTITPAGRLIISKVLRWEEVPKAERPYPEAPDDTLQGMCGSIRAITEKVDANHHGYVRMIALEDLPNGCRHWHEYSAKFTDGQLVGIELVASRIS